MGKKPDFLWGKTPAFISVIFFKKKFALITKLYLLKT